MPKRKPKPKREMSQKEYEEQHFFISYDREELNKEIYRIAERDGWFDEKK
jgi:hypothetical protein